MNRDVPVQAPAAFDEGFLDCHDGHRVWYGQYGNPRGMPLLWLHGGPGSGSSLRHLLLFDLAHYRVVLCDQRGCGRSTPAGALHRNDTDLLVGDIARLRDHLQLGRVVIGGGSWGATLALAHASVHAADVAALVLRAPFLASWAEVDAFFAPFDNDTHGAWEEFAALAPPSHRGALLPWLAGELASGSHDQRARIAHGWRRYEQLRENAVVQPTEEAAMISRYRIQSHYLLHGCFLNEAELLDAARSLPGMPVALLHGDADRVCPPQNAHRLHRCLPDSRLCIVPGAGHDPFHAGTASALAQALAAYARDAHFGGWGMGNE